MRIFISYASEDQEISEQIHLSLLAEGHQTFFDKDNLPPGDDFHSRIRSTIDECDLLIFLISEHSILKGCYALSELKYARKKWPHPKGRIIPVVTEKISWERIPTYLKSVTILDPEGDVAAEVIIAVAELEHQIKLIGKQASVTSQPPLAKINSILNERFLRSNRRVFILLTLLFLIVFGASFRFLLNSTNKPPSIGSYDFTKTIPFESGWIFIGYFDFDDLVYLEGPYANIVHRAKITGRQKEIPFIGDILQIRKSRNIIIAKFKTHGLKYQLSSPPLVKEILTDEDYTGVKLSKDTLVLIRDVEISASQAKRASIWCRIVECDESMEYCQSAGKR